MAHVDAHGHDDHADGHAVADGDDLPHHGPVIAEPRSPAWLPLLGLALLGLLLVWWLSTPNDAEEARAEAAAASASASAAGSAAAPSDPLPPKPEFVPPPRPAAPPNAAPPPRPGQPNAAPAATLNPHVKLK